jgi:hypothetical protein
VSYRGKVLRDQMSKFQLAMEIHRTYAANRKTPIRSEVHSVVGRTHVMSNSVGSSKR